MDQQPTLFYTINECLCRGRTSAMHESILQRAGLSWCSTVLSFYEARQSRTPLVQRPLLQYTVQYGDTHVFDAFHGTCRFVVVQYIHRHSIQMHATPLKTQGSFCEATSLTSLQLAPTTSILYCDCHAGQHRSPRYFCRGSGNTTALYSMGVYLLSFIMLLHRQ
jgi:hypothetical protein